MLLDVDCRKDAGSQVQDKGKAKQDGGYEIAVKGRRDVRIAGAFSVLQRHLRRVPEVIVYHQNTGESNS